jgi:hypothetical protein
MLTRSLVGAMADLDRARVRLLLEGGTQPVVEKFDLTFQAFRQLQFLRTGWLGWVVPTEIAYDLAASTDKTLAYVYGATHGFSPCTACQTDPGLLGDTEAILVDYLAQWLASHVGR